MKEFLHKTVRKAGQMALDYLGTEDIIEKSPKDFVTEADIAVEKFIVSEIRKEFPEHDIIGEEHDYKDKQSEFTWYIDPIDGTANYAHGDIHFAISVGVKKQHEMKYAAVYIPMIDEIYYAEKDKGAFLNNKKIQVSKISKLKDAFIQAGISPTKEKNIDNSLKFFRELQLNAFRARDLGFCAGQLAFVAAGRADALVKITQHPWDFAAGILLVSEAGGKVTDEKGNKVIPGREDSRHNIIVSNSIIHDQLLRLVNSDKLKDVDIKTPWW